jgi:hypothetical protein
MRHSLCLAPGIDPPYARLGEAATLATPWGHQTQSLPGFRNICSFGTCSLRLGEADIGFPLGTSDTASALASDVVLCPRDFLKNFFIGRYRYMEILEN